MCNTTFVFSGQGSQYAGMGKSVMERYSFCKRYFEEASDILNMNLLALCCDGNEDALRDTTVSQPAILTVSYLRFLGYCEEHAPDALFYAGHSLGEYSALLAAGVLDFGEAIKLIGLRATCMKKCAAANQGTMIAVVCNDGYEQILPIIRRIRTETGKTVSIGCINSSRQIVLSGSSGSIQKIAEALTAADNVRSVPLYIDGAFHSPMMSDAAEEFREVLNCAKFNALSDNYGILSNVTGVPYVNMDEIRSELVLQLTHPVHWLGSVRYLVEHGVDTFVEFGAKPTLTQLIKKEVSVNAFPYN